MRTFCILRKPSESMFTRWVYYRIVRREAAKAISLQEAVVLHLVSFKSLYYLLSKL